MAVLDTSVLMSGHRHWLWLLADEGYYQPVWSPFIVGELVRIRVERAIHFGQPRELYRARVNELVHVLSDVCQVVNHRATAGTAGILPDPDDAPILATALAAGASHVVSLNTHDFPRDGVALGVRFITPADFLALLIDLYSDSDLRGRAGESGPRIP